MTKARLQILICTFGTDGLHRVAAMCLPQVPQVAYIVSCQLPEGDEAQARAILSDRPDVEMYIHRDRGLGLNRRHALDHADAEFVLLDDDDLQYYAAALAEALRIMESHPCVDVFAFRYDGPDNKLYPAAEHDLSVPLRNYNLTSFELAFRLSAVRSAGLNFSALLGVGAPYLEAAEESIFTERCLQAGLRGRFFPLTICRHPGLTTGLRSAARPGVIRSTAAYIRIRYGLCQGLLRCLLLARRAPVPYFKGLLYALQGMAYSIKHNKDL